MSESILIFHNECDLPIEMCDCQNAPFKSIQCTCEGDDNECGYCEGWGWLYQTNTPKSQTYRLSGPINHKQVQARLRERLRGRKW